MATTPDCTTSDQSPTLPYFLGFNVEFQENKVMLPSDTELTSVANYTLVGDHVENKESGGFDSTSSSAFNSAGISTMSDYTSAYCNDLTAINAFIDSLKSDCLLERDKIFG